MSELTDKLLEEINEELEKRIYDDKKILGLIIRIELDTLARLKIIEDILENGYMGERF